MTEIRKQRTEEESEKLGLRMDALASQIDTSFIDGMNKYQTNHVLIVQQKYERFLRQFEMSFCQMATYSISVNYLSKREWHASRTMQFVIATYSLKQFHSAYLLLRLGMYEDAMTILRSVYESFLRIVFISVHPEAYENAYKTTGQTGTRFNATGLINDELGLDWDTYGILSAFAHSNQFDVMGTMVDLETKEQTEPICLSYTYDDVRTMLCIGVMQFLLAAFLYLFDQVFTVDYSKHEERVVIQEAIEQLHMSADIALELLAGQSSEYWRSVAGDLKDVFSLMDKMDAGSTAGWKSEWQLIRLAE